MISQHAALALASLFIVLILASAVLGPSYTGLHGDWLEGSVEFQGQTYVAEVGLNEVVLTTGAGESRRLPLRDACAMAGSRDSAASKWCSLDQLGADTEAMLTTAFVPALVVLALSALTALRNCIVGRTAALQYDPDGHVVNGDDGGTCFSAVYNLTMLIAWSLFCFMCTVGLCTYSYRAPASIGVGRASFSKSYGLMRACVLFTAMGTLALATQSARLWDTATVQSFIRDYYDSRPLKLAIYSMIGIQLLLYIPLSLIQLDYAFVLCLLGANYLATRAVQMLWSYTLLTLLTIPQDLAGLAGVAAWSSMDLIERIARLSFILISLLKLACLVGMFLMHTRVRFKLQFFEFKDEDEEEPPALSATHSSPGAVYGSQYKGEGAAGEHMYPPARSRQQQQGAYELSP